MKTTKPYCVACSKQGEELTMETLTLILRGPWSELAAKAAERGIPLVFVRFGQEGLVEAQTGRQHQDAVIAWFLADRAVKHVIQPNRGSLAFRGSGPCKTIEEAFFEMHAEEQRLTIELPINAEDPYDSANVGA